MTNEQNNTEQKCSVFTTTNDPTQVNQAREIAIHCDNCDKDITLDDIKALCPSSIGKQIRNGKKKTITKKGTPKGAKKETITIDETVAWEEWMEDGITCLNKYRKQVGINTCVAKAHFLAQLAHESKYLFKTQEIFDYYWQGLNIFTAFQTTEGQEKAKLWGRAEKESPAVSSANQINIANWAYQDQYENGDFASGDGYRYSGKGFIHLTFKENYRKMTEAFNKLVKEINDENDKNCKSAENEAPVDWVNNPDNLRFNAREAMAASLAFWRKNNINNIAIYNSEKCVIPVTKIINKELKGIDDRIKFFKKAVKVLNVNECEKEKFFNNLKNDRSGTVVVVSGIGSKKIKSWVVYETSVYKHTSLDRYKQEKQGGNPLKADKTIFLARDAHGKRKNYNEFRYCYNNEAPPGEYYLISDIATSPKQASKLYISDNKNAKTITVIVPPKNEGNSIEQKDVQTSSAQDKKTENSTKEPKEIKRTICIKYGDPATALGDLISLGTISIVNKLLKDIPDLYAVNGHVRIIIEEREVEQGSWAKKGKPQTINKWTGVLPKPKTSDTAQKP